MTRRANISRLLYPLVCMLCGLSCCMRATVRLDLDTYLQQQPMDDSVEVIITAPLNDVLARYGLYEGKVIEVTAPVGYFGSAGFWTWHLMLSDNGTSLRCYTHHYRVEPGWDAVNLLAVARSRKAPVTVLGILRREGVDIERITCDGASADPNYKPPRPGSGWWLFN